MSSLNDFQILEKLGEGAYSSVYKVKRISDQNEYAIKKVRLNNLSEKELKNSINEVRILASIHNKNIISYKEAFFDKLSKCLCIVMEYANNGDLYNKITSHQKNKTFFEEKEMWIILIQVISGLRTLHNLNILHRDLKSANVFLNIDLTAKLGDLNVSKITQKGLGYTQTGTPYYASPEVWRDQPYDKKSDIWSLGCVAYEMASLKPPFRAEDMSSLYKKVLKGVYQDISPRYSKEYSGIIKQLLQASPHSRPTCDQLLAKSVIRKYADEFNITLEDSIKEEDILMQTIRIPKNMMTLSDKLPKPNYDHSLNSQSPINEFSNLDDTIKDTFEKKRNIRENSEKIKLAKHNSLLEIFHPNHSIFTPLKQESVAENNRNSSERHQIPVKILMRIQDQMKAREVMKRNIALNRIHVKNRMKEENSEQKEVGLYKKVIKELIDRDSPKIVIQQSEKKLPKIHQINYSLLDGRQQLERNNQLILPSIQKSYSRRLSEEKIMDKYFNKEIQKKLALYGIHKGIYLKNNPILIKKPNI